MNLLCNLGSYGHNGHGHPSHVQSPECDVQQSATAADGAQTPVDPEATHPTPSTLEILHGRRVCLNVYQLGHCNRKPGLSTEMDSPGFPFQVYPMGIDRDNG